MPDCLAGHTVCLNCFNYTPSAFMAAKEPLWAGIMPRFVASNKGIAEPEIENCLLVGCAWQLNAGKFP